jgi:XTP/dITP diphosphohydrolase
MNLLIATGNRHKAAELGQLLGSGGADSGNQFDWLDLCAAAARFGPAPEVEETGKTFLANACLKAAAYASRYDMWALADDSGLEIDALAGGPGVRSARWAADHNAGSGDADNNALVLSQLEAVPDDRRSARFVCVLALADPKGRVIMTARGSVEGRILRHPRGSSGFGYDPLFLLPDRGVTTAELPPEEKNALSHRGRAVQVLRPLLGLIQNDEVRGPAATPTTLPLS